MAKGLYTPGEFRDNCGFGLIAHCEGEASHDLLMTSIEALTRMTHRGGIAADGKTGDGCGLLFQMPDAFMRRAAKDAIGVELGDLFAVGMLFLPNDSDAEAQAVEVINDALNSRQLPDEENRRTLAHELLRRPEEATTQARSRDEQGISYRHGWGDLPWR